MRPGSSGSVGALALALAACGAAVGAAACGSAADVVDGTPADAEPATPPDARVETITVIVLTEPGEVDHGTELPAGVPRPDTDVYFIAPGNIVHRVVTDAAGAATSPPVAPGTSVIAVRRRGSTDYMLTIYRQLEPGQVITIGPTAQLPPLGYHEQPMLITFTPLDGLAVYAASSACGTLFQTDVATFTFPIQIGCDHTDRSVLITATSFTGELLGWTTRRTDLVAGATLAMPAFQPIPTLVANLSTIDGVRTLGFDGTYRDRPDAAGPPVEPPAALFDFFEQVDDSNTGTVVHVPVAPAGDELVLVAKLDDGLSDHAPIYLSRTVDHAVTSTLMDLGARLPIVSTPADFDADDARVSWTEGVGRRGDAIVAGGTYNVPDGGTFGNITVTYRIFGPHTPGGIAFPAIPSELDQLAPRHTTGGGVDYLLLIDDVGEPSYRAIVPSLDADARMLFQIGPRQFGDAGDVWFSGFGL
jgi:hypothetical protein